MSKSYGDRAVLDGFDLQVAPGECVALVGENGVGKTTVLQLCAGMLIPDDGTVRCLGTIGYCPQEPGVVDLLSAQDHLVLFGAIAGLARGDAQTQGTELLRTLGFPVRDLTVPVRELSGGTRQKLNLALSLLGDPDVLLLDEPYQGFDHGSYVDFWEHVGGWRDAGRAVVIVTHLLTEQHRVDRVVDVGAARSTGRPTTVEVGV